VFYFNPTHQRGVLDGWAESSEICAFKKIKIKKRSEKHFPVWENGGDSDVATGMTYGVV
jgi:hypothetical protein